MSSSGSVNNTAPVTQRAKRAYRNQLKQLQTAEYFAFLRCRSVWHRAGR